MIQFDSIRRGGFNETASFTAVVLSIFKPKTLCLIIQRRICLNGTVHIIGTVLWLCELPMGRVNGVFN